ncbi:uncharacterized protein LW94_14973 [Fusarium fujikuroi]|nr:uncharacterized protein LW94_14973 [Fusarium fujikuroi]SCV26300.1 uncharacterized protein FFB14_00995 [Fusarium fujikuroi]
MACGFSPEGAGVEKKQSDPWIPTWPGEEITSRRDVLSWSNFGLRFRAAGPRAGGSPTDLIPAFNPCPPFPTTRLRESFVLGVRRGAVGTAKEGALRAGLCCRRGGALSTLVDPQLCYPSEASLGGLEVTVLAGLGQRVLRSPVLTVKGNSCCGPTPKEDARAATVESALDLALSSRG